MQPHQSQLIGLVRSLAKETLRGAEIGVFRGETSHALLKAFPQLALYLIDSWTTFAVDHPYRRSGDRCARRSQKQQDAIAGEAIRNTEFAAHRRYIVREPSAAAADRIADRSLDFVFIDGDHTCDAVRDDLRAWYPKLRVGGLLCGHDYGHPRDRRGLFGVKRAVDAFAEFHDLELSTGKGDMWWLHKPEPRSCVIVPVHGHTAMTHELVGDLRRENTGILIVDNKGDYEPLADEWIVRNSENLGWAGGCNAGLDVAARERFEAFVIMNNDVRLAAGHVAGLERGWRDTGAALVGPMLNFKKGPQRCWTPLEEFVPVREHRPVPILDGVSLLIPRTTYERVGTLDTENLGFLCYCGHADYCIRALRKMWRPNIVTQLSLLFHRRTVTAKSVMPAKQRRMDVRRGERGATRKYGRRNWRRIARETLKEILADPESGSRPKKPASMRDDAA